MKDMVNMYADENRGVELLAYLQRELCTPKGMFAKSNFDKKCPVCLRHFSTPSNRNRHITTLKCPRIKRATQEEHKKMLEDGLHFAELVKEERQRYKQLYKLLFSLQKTNLN